MTERGRFPSGAGLFFVFVGVLSCLRPTSLVVPERVIREWDVPGLEPADVEARSRR